jgi:hypothetical protein
LTSPLTMSLNPLRFLSCSPVSGNDDYTNWSVGLFMHDADFQGGALSPIVSVLVRDADGCDTNKVALCAGHRNVTFGNKWRDTMRGMWPIEVEDHGIGYSTGRGVQ